MHARGLEFRDAVEDLAGEGAGDARPAPAPVEAKHKATDEEDAAREAFIRRMVDEDGSRASSPSPARPARAICATCARSTRARSSTF